MANLQEITNRKKLNLVFKMLCNYFGHAPSDIRIRTKKREVVMMRQIYYYFCKKYLPRITLSEIGGLLGYDHATVIHGHNVIEDLVECDKRIALQINEATLFFKKKILPQVDVVDPRDIPENTYQKIKFEKNNAEAKANKMYYIAKKFLMSFNRHINEDRVIEGFRRKELDDKYWIALKTLEEIKNQDDLTIN